MEVSKSPEKPKIDHDDKKWSSGKKKRSGNKLIKLIPCNSASNSPEVEPQEDTSDENDGKLKIIDQHWKDLNYDRLINDLDHYIQKLDTELQVVEKKKHKMSRGNSSRGSV